VATEAVEVEVAGKDVRVTNPSKVFFARSGITKLDIVNYYLSVMPGALLGARERPTTMYRWPNGVEAPDDAFYQKRAPSHRPEWLATTTIRFPSGRSAEMPVVADAAHIVWLLNLGCLDINPWPVRRSDVDRPDELRIDLDPTPGIPFSDARKVAMCAQSVLDDYGLAGFPKTSGKRGIHIYVRIEPEWDFTEVRRAALALAREVERRVPDIATTAWWKEQRHGVFVDYNQNARDRTIASAYSIRPVSDARVSCPLLWSEVEDVEPEELNISTVGPRVEKIGDAGAAIDDSPGRLDSLLELAARDEREGLGDAPWPPHFPKAKSEPPRVQPSRRKKAQPRDTST